MKFPTLRDLVRFGIPAATSKPSLADKKAAAEAKRQAVYDTRARKCVAELTRVASLLTPAEFPRHSKRLDMAARTALKQKSSLKDLRLDLSDLLPADLAARCGLPTDADAAPVAKNPWRSRASYSQLVKDESGEQTVTAQMIIEAAAKARGAVPPEKQIDPRQRWNRK